MMCFRFTACVLGLGLVLRTSAAVLPALQAREVNCSSPETGLDSSCWATLGLTDYVQQYWQSKSAAQRAKGFARCFLDDIQQVSMNCDVLQNNACTPPTPQAIQDPKNFYIAYNIYAINQAYNTYSIGLTQANTVAAEMVPNIVQLLDPPQQTQVLFNDLLTALSAGLAFVSADDPLITAFVKGVTQVAAVAKFVFPEGTTDSRQQELATVTQSLGELVQMLQGNIAHAVPATLNDTNAFLAFASSGAFSVPPRTSIFDDSARLLKALNTYIVSQTLQANNIVLTKPIQNMDVNKYAHDNSNLKIGSKGSCGNGYDSLGICDAWYYDKTANQSYGFISMTNGWTHNYHDEMETIFSKYTDPTLLIINAVACNAAGNSQKPGDVISATNQTVNIDCLSNLKVCTWSPDAQVNNLFKDCDNPSEWASAGGCEGNEDATKLPPAYIGPLIDADSLYGYCY